MWQTLTEIVGFLSGVVGLISAIVGLVFWLNKKRCVRTAIGADPLPANPDPNVGLQIQHAQSVLRTPALALLIIGVLGSAIGFLGAASSLLIELPGTVGLAEQQGVDIQAQPKESAAKPGRMREYNRERINVNRMFKFVSVFYGGIGLLGVVSVLGAIAMLNLKYHLIAVGGSIAAMCSLLCCYAGIPVGIWCLWLLFQPEIKRAFENN